MQSCRPQTSSASMWRKLPPQRYNVLRKVPGALTLVCRGRSAGSSKIEHLLNLCSSTNRGQSTEPDIKAEILNTIKQLKSTQTSVVTTGQEVSATWKLIWTTEKETLFILQNAALFGTEAGDVYQNVISFPPNGAFIVDSSISVGGDQRIEFKFNGAKLKVNGNGIPFPPFGKGWFDTVYIDEEIRIAEDIRGDTLVVRRDGPPRQFD